MYVRENEKLYLSNWEYNTTLLIKELAKIAENHGAEITTKPRTWYAENRTLSTAIREQKKRIERVKEYNHTESREKVLYKLTCELEDLERIDNTPVQLEYTTYIAFKLDGLYYTWSMQDNPFDAATFSKRKIYTVPGKGDNVIKNYYSDTCRGEWWLDCLLSFRCNTEERKEIANLIFNELMAADLSEIYYEKTRKRVSNTYNSGYHYETVTSENQYTEV